MRRAPARLSGLLPARAPTGTASPGPGEEAAAGRRGGPMRSCPVVIAHRGASGYRPEHTLGAYALAIAQGADYVEPDVVSTGDGVLVARHENEMSGTTDVSGHPKFSDRETTKVIDGVEVRGWFTEDFTLAELQTLRARERLPLLRPQNAVYDGLEQIPTLQAVIDLVAAVNATRPPEARIGIAPETKHPTYYDGIGLALEPRLLEVLARNGLEGGDAAVVIQSFETANLRELARWTEVPLAQLVSDRGAPFDLVASGDPRTYADLATPAGLAEMAGYADVVGAHKALVVPVGDDGRPGRPTSLVADAHRVGLAVHIWTVRRENQFLPAALRSGDAEDPAWSPGDVEAELRALYLAGVDGVFSDNPDVAVAVRDGLGLGQSRRRGAREPRRAPGRAPADADRAYG